MRLTLEGSDRSVKALKKYVGTWLKRNGIKEVEDSEGSEELGVLKEENRNLTNNLNNYKSKLKKANAEITDLKKAE